MIRFLQSGNKAVKYLLGALLTIICLSMVVYLIPGLSGDMSLRQPDAVATVAGEKITAQEVALKMEQVQRQQRQRYPDFLRPYLLEQVTRELVQEAELRYEAQRMGLTATDEEVRDEMREGPYRAYFFPNGNWIGQKQYEDMLANAGLNVAQFEEQVRLEVLRNKLMTAVTAGVDVAPSDIEREYRNQKLKVKFDYVIVDGEELQKKVTATDAELRAYFTTNQNTYQNAIPEKRAVSYFVVSNQLAESRVTVTPDDIAKYYNANQDKYRVAERVKVRHIQINLPPAGADGKVDPKALDAARAKANDLLKQLKAGADFAELAKKNSDDKSSAPKGGELEMVTRGQFPSPEFDKAAFSLNKGQISDPVQTALGIHIIQVLEKEDAHMKPLSEVRDDIERELKSQKRLAAIQQLSDAALADARAMGIDKAAGKYGAQAVHSNPVAKTDTLPGIGPAPEVMNAIFATDDKAPAQMARTGLGVAVLKVDKIVPARTPTLEEIKDRVTKDFKTERSNTLLNQKVQDLANRARVANDLSKAAKELGLTVKSSGDPVGRDGTVTDIGSMGGPASVVFNMKVGDISAPVTLGRKSAVLAVTAIQEPSMGEDFAKAKDGIREQLIGPKRQQAMDLYMGGLDARLQKEGKVKRNKTEMDNLSKSPS